MRSRGVQVSGTQAWRAFRGEARVCAGAAGGVWKGGAQPTPGSLTKASGLHPVGRERGRLWRLEETGWGLGREPVARKRGWFPSSVGERRERRRPDGCWMLDARCALPATLRWEGGVAVACRLWADQAASLYPPATQETQQLVGATPAHQETSPRFARREPSGHTKRRLDHCVSHCHLVSLGLSSLTPRGFASTSHTPAPRPLTGGTDPAPVHRAPAALGPSRRPRCPPSATPRRVGMPFLRFLCDILESPVLL